MEGVGDVEGVGLRGDELMDVSAVPDDTLPVRYMEVTGYFIHIHISINTASF